MPLYRVSYQLMEKQPLHAACWISAAHFVLALSRVELTMGQLLATYSRGPGAAAADAGAGTGAGAGAGAGTAGGSSATASAGGQVYESKVAGSAAMTTAKI